MENISKNLLFFGTDDQNSFDSYHLIDKKENNDFKKILIYNISKKVKEIDRKAQKALYALYTLLFNSVSIQEEKTAYKTLDIFLVTTPNFRKYIRNIDTIEIEALKRTVISSMIEKIYDNITKDRGVSNLRFALVLLKNGLNKLNNNLQSHIFYDIQNGVNINREIEKNFTKKIQDSINQRVLIKEIKPHSNNIIESLIKKEDEKRFINAFLKTLLSMPSILNSDTKKIVILVSYMSYITSTKDIKTTIKNGIEKIQIAHPFIMFIEYQAKYNCSNFILILDEFIKDKSNQEIEEFLAKKTSVDKKNLTIKNGTIRQKNLKFLKNLLIIGNFFKLISEEKNVESIIDSIQKKVLEKSIDTEKYSKETISSKFLKLFVKEYRKKDCEIKLKDFFKSFRENLLLQKKHPQKSISRSVALTSHL